MRFAKENILKNKYQINKVMLLKLVLKKRLQVPLRAVCKATNAII